MTTQDPQRLEQIDSPISVIQDKPAGSTPVVTVNTTPPPLSDMDIEALRRSVRDLSVLEQGTLDRARDGFRRAYEVAAEIVDGTRNPLLG